MKRSELVAIADAIGVVRPDWNQAGIIAALQAWQGTPASLLTHAATVAADPASRTPAAINAGSPTAKPKHGSKEPACDTCGKTQATCDEIRLRDVEFDLDPHPFETREQAEANASRRQIDAKIRARIDAEEAQRKAAWEPSPPPSDRRIQEPQPELEETPA